MPCFSCGARQSDPGKGPSPWKRGVAGGEQVLVCPDCQRDEHWQDRLDRCGACGSTMLVRALGETRCRQCSWAAAAEIASGPPADRRLADEVAAALDRRFGR